MYPPPGETELDGKSTGEVFSVDVKESPLNEAPYDME